MPDENRMMRRERLAARQLALTRQLGMILSGDQDLSLLEDLAVLGKCWLTFLQAATQYRPTDRAFVLREVALAAIEAAERLEPSAPAPAAPAAGDPAGDPELPGSWRVRFLAICTPGTRGR
jgi:hypothetical protein